MKLNEILTKIGHFFALKFERIMNFLKSFIKKPNENNFAQENSPSEKDSSTKENSSPEKDTSTQENSPPEKDSSTKENSPPEKDSSTKATSLVKDLVSKTKVSTKNEEKKRSTSIVTMGNSPTEDPLRHVDSLTTGFRTDTKHVNNTYLYLEKIGIDTYSSEEPFSRLTKIFDLGARFNYNELALQKEIGISILEKWADYKVVFKYGTINLDKATSFIYLFKKFTYLGADIPDSFLNSVIEDHKKESESKKDHKKESEHKREKSEDKKEKSEDKKEKSEDKKEKSEDKKEKSEDKKEKSEDKKEKSEDKKEKSEDKKEESKPRKNHGKKFKFGENTEFDLLDEKDRQVAESAQTLGLTLEPGKALNEQDIKAAYRKKALVTHPDKVSEVLKEQATEKMKKLNAANDMLRDLAASEYIFGRKLKSNVLNPTPPSNYGSNTRTRK